MGGTTQGGTYSGFTIDNNDKLEFNWIMDYITSGSATESLRTFLYGGNAVWLVGGFNCTETAWGSSAPLLYTFCQWNFLDGVKAILLLIGTAVVASLPLD